MEWLKPGHRRKSRLQERRDPIVLPDPVHIQMVIDQAPPMIARIIMTAIKTGARLDELKKSERNHFDKVRRQLTIVGKRNKLRVIDLEDGEDFGFAILSGLPVTLETKALFWHRREVKGRSRLGRQPARPYRELNFDRLVEAAAEQAQNQDQHFRPFRFHDLRHVHAVNWLKSGRSIYALQQRLGHTSVRTTEMYLAYLTAEEKQQAMFGASRTGTKTGSRAAVKNSENG
jgi:integrase/recombinase XerD